MQIKTTKTSHTPVQMHGGPKHALRCQCAALCYRESQNAACLIDVCLVTSRDTGRWVLPKGWPMDGKTLPEAAAIEAWEEAGLRGDVSSQPLGTYSYQKTLKGKVRPILGLIYPMSVHFEAETWPESDQRQRLWMPPDDAADLVNESDLKVILSHLSIV